MSALGIGVLCSVCLATLPQEGNRLWWADLKVRGPADSLELTLAEGGGTRIGGEFVGGEELERALPVPLVSPLGSAGLSSASMPQVRFSGEGSAALVAWSEDQPAAEFGRVQRSFLHRARPVPELQRSCATTGQLVILFAAGLFLLGGRRSRPMLVAFSIVGGAALVASTYGGFPGPDGVSVLEVDLARGQAVEIRSAYGKLDLADGIEWLEVLPEGAAVWFHTDPRSAGQLQATSDGSLLCGMRRAVVVTGLRLSKNEWAGLEQVWTRSKAGSWRIHGPWPYAAELPPGRSMVAAADDADGEPMGLPGWLASGLAPGDGVLIGLRQNTKRPFWVRITGWEP